MKFYHYSGGGGAVSYKSALNPRKSRRDPGLPSANVSRKFGKYPMDVGRARRKPFVPIARPNGPKISSFIRITHRNISNRSRRSASETKADRHLGPLKKGKKCINIALKTDFPTINHQQPSDPS